MKIKQKIIFFLLPLMLYIGGCNACNSTTGPDDNKPRPTTVRVDYQRYIAGGVNPSAADRASVVMTWGISGRSQQLVKQSEDNFYTNVSIETNQAITGHVGDPRMFDRDTGDSRSSEQVALYVRLDGQDVIKISNGCTSPWSGIFRFMKKNDGTIEMLKQ